MNTSDVLNRAADLIEERGWTKGVAGFASDPSNTGPLCLEGGIEAASGVSRWDNIFAFWGCPAYRAVADYLDIHKVWHFNDEPGRTAAEVIEVLRAAALIEAAREDQEAAWATYAELVSA